MGTSDRRPYLTATTLDQDLLDECQDNLTGRLEMIAELDSPTGILYMSDRAKYVGSTFYYPRVEFPVIDRTVGDWLAGELEFSSIELRVNNADGFYSNVNPGGADYDGWIGRRITIKIGLAEEASTYTTIFTGLITDVAGFSRDTSTFTIQARSDYEKVNVQIPNQLLIPDDFPNIEDDKVGLGAPIIYGNWTINLRPEAPEIPAFPVNGADPTVTSGATAVRCVISSVPLKSVDTTSLVVFRGDAYYPVPSGDVAIVPFTDNQIIDVTQMGFLIDGNPWLYESGDQILLKCEGVDLSGLDSNIVEQAKDILMRFGGLVLGDFDATWDYFRAKTLPVQSSIATIDSRVWIQESINVMEQVTSMLEQVRLEPFINRTNMFSLTSLHFEEFDDTPPYAIKQWDVVLGTFQPKFDDRNNWNRAKADFSFSPALNQDRLSTALYRNQAAIDQADEKLISKLIDFPNLTQESDVVYQLTEMLRLASSYCEMIDVTLTQRAFLKDIGDYVYIDVNIGAVEFGTGNVVGIIRSIGYDPKGVAITAKLWSLQMVNFPGYTGPPGTVGGYNAVVTKET